MFDVIDLNCVFRSPTILSWLLYIAVCLILSHFFRSEAEAMKDMSKGIPQKWRLFFKLFCYLSPQNISQDSIESTFMFEQVNFKGSWSVSRGTGQFQGEQVNFKGSWSVSRGTGQFQGEQVSFKGNRSVSRGTGQFQGELVSFKGNRSVSGERSVSRGTGQFQGEQGFAGTYIAIRNV